jgi:hypothetical protein
MKTLAERAFEKGKLLRPTAFVPNGCGPAAAGSADFVPDTLFGVKFGHACCDPHDLEYYRGGFWGLFWRKPKADIKLGACLARKMLDQGHIHRNYGMSRKDTALGYAQTVAAVPVGAIYALGVLVFGWTPLTWRWRERPVPLHNSLEALKRNVAVLPRGDDR